MRETIQGSLTIRYETLGLYIVIGISYCIIIAIAQTIYRHIKIKEAKKEKAFTKYVDDFWYTESLNQYKEQTPPHIRNILKKQLSYPQRWTGERTSIQQTNPNTYEKIEASYSSRSKTKKHAQITKTIITILSLGISSLINKN